MEWWAGLASELETKHGASLFGGMEWWNRTVEWNSGMEWWNSGMTAPADRVLSRPIPTIFQDTYSSLL